LESWNPDVIRTIHGYDAAAEAWKTAGQICFGRGGGFPVCKLSSGYVD